MNRMTYSCENITFPHTLYTVGNYCSLAVKVFNSKTNLMRIYGYLGNITCPAINQLYVRVSYDQPPVEEGRYREGTTASFSCEDGLFENGSKTRQCQ